MRPEKYREELLELKKKLLECLEPELKEIKVKYKSIEDMKQEIDCAVNCFISTEIFEKDLDDKELDIFLDTYCYMLFYAPVIDGVLSELYSKCEKDEEIDS